MLRGANRLYLKIYRTIEHEGEAAKRDRGHNGDARRTL
jgi:hypothetical protein